MNRRIFRRTALGLVFGLVILACASPVLIPPPAPSTVVPGSLETTIAKTAVAARTQTQVVLPPTQTQTNTPSSTQTATTTPTTTATILFIFQTETSLPEGLFAEDDWYDEDDDSGFVKPPVLREWDCRLISQSPPKGTVIKGGSDFRAVWTVENTGTKTWPKQGVDIVYHSGAHLHEGKPYYDIPRAVGPGGRVTITIAMSVPKLSKEYSTRWSLRVGNRDFCAIRFSIEVE
jgi:hypothetical protein